MDIQFQFRENCQLYSEISFFNFKSNKSNSYLDENEILFINKLEDMLIKLEYEYKNAKKYKKEEVGFSRMFILIHPWDLNDIYKRFRLKRFYLSYGFYLNGLLDTIDLLRSTTSLPIFENLFEKIYRKHQLDKEYTGYFNQFIENFINIILVRKAQNSLRKSEANKKYNQACHYLDCLLKTYDELTIISVNFFINTSTDFFFASTSKDYCNQNHYSNSSTEFYPQSVSLYKKIFSDQLLNSNYEFQLKPYFFNSRAVPQSLQTQHFFPGPPEGGATNVKNIRSQAELLKQHLQRLLNNGRHHQVLSDCVGYLGRWDYRPHTGRFAHVVLCYEAKKIYDVEFLKEALQSYWCQNITDGNCNLRYVEISSVQGLLKDGTKLRGGNKRKVQAFKEHVIRYFTHAELYLSYNISFSGNTFLKGKMTSVLEEKDSKKVVQPKPKRSKNSVYSQAAKPVHSLISGNTHQPMSFSVELNTNYLVNSTKFTTLEKMDNFQEQEQLVDHSPQDVSHIYSKQNDFKSENNDSFQFLPNDESVSEHKSTREKLRDTLLKYRK